MTTQSQDKLDYHTAETDIPLNREPISIGRNGIAIGHNPEPLAADITVISEWDGKQATADIVGLITAQDAPYSVAIARRPDFPSEEGTLRGYALLVGEFEDGIFQIKHLSTPSSSYANHISTGVPNSGSSKTGYITVESMPRSNYEFEVKSFDVSDPKLQLSEGAKVVKRPKIDGILKTPEERRTILRTRVTKAAAAIAFAATVAPGGLIDKSADPFIGTDPAVAEAAAGMHRVASPRSIMEKEMAPFPGGLEKYYETINTENEQVDSAIATVQELMRNLDTHSNDVVQSQADAYVAAHASNILPSDKATAIQEQIQQAESNDAILSALQELGDYFGISFRFSDIQSSEIAPFDPNTHVSDTQRLALAIHGVISKMPKSFVKQTRTTTIELGDFQRNLAPVLGLADTFGGRLRFAVMPLSDIIGYSLVSGKPINYESIVRHEITHHAQDMVDMDTTLSNDPANPFIYIGSRLIGYPVDQSIYAALSDAEEKRAESFANGPEHPDQTRNYISPANRTALRWLVRSELEDPGSAAYYATYFYKLAGN